MVPLSQGTVQNEILKVVTELNETLGIGATINVSCRPGDLIASHVLLAITPLLEESLGVTIPIDIYIFYDKVQKQLSIEEAAQKLIKLASNGN